MDILDRIRQRAASRPQHIVLPEGNDPRTVTAAAEAGMPESLIMQRTGHRSVQTVSKYVRPASVFSVDVLASAM